MPPSRLHGRSSSTVDGVSVIDIEWVRQHAAHDVAEALEAMQAAVRSGRMQEARNLGASASVPLSLTASELSLHARISEGAESVVWRGKYQNLDVAVKKFKIGTSEDLRRFRKELLLLASFNHPNVVPILGAKALPPDYSLVLPLHGDNLHHKLHQQGWRPLWHEAIRIGVELASAVCHMHEKGVLHRDIKPGNLLMTSSGSIQLSDFGTAELQSRLQEAAEDTSGKYRLGHKPSGGFHRKLMAGTLEYMAPEVLLKEAQTPAADVYAVAVTINELATGTLPYSDCNKDNPDCHTVLEMGYNRQELAAAIVGAGLRPLLPKPTPPGFRKLMEACWQLNPYDRPSAPALLAALQQLEASLATWQHSLSFKYSGLPHSVSMCSVSSWTLATGVDQSIDKCMDNDKCTDITNFSSDSATQVEVLTYRGDDSGSSDGGDSCSMQDFDILSQSMSEKELVLNTKELEVKTTSGARRTVYDYLSHSHIPSLSSYSLPQHSCTASAQAGFQLTEQFSSCLESDPESSSSQHDASSSQQEDSDMLMPDSLHSSDPCDPALLAQSLAQSSAAEGHALQYSNTSLHHMDSHADADPEGLLGSEGLVVLDRYGCAETHHRMHVTAGVFDTAGAREKMEDRSVVATGFCGSEKLHLFGVFDGHRGRAAADFVAQNLPGTLARAMAACAAKQHSPTQQHSVEQEHLPRKSVRGCTQRGEHMQAASAQFPEAQPTGYCVFTSQGLVPTALTQAFLDLDQQFAVQQEQEWRNRVARMGLFAAGHRPFPGCTALVTLLVGNTLYTANAGDCRAVVARRGNAVQLNREHNADCLEERARVEKAGGEVVQARDGWRVGNSGIQVTRSIGDLDEKQGGVTAVPEVTRVELSAEDEFLIIGSDGLWQHISNEEAVGMVRDTVKEPFMCGKRLATEAIVRGSRDNITAMVVFLTPVSTLERVFADGVAKHSFTATEYSSRT